MALRNTPSPELSSREAAYNMALLGEHEKEAGKKSKRELYFGVYRSRTFIFITRSTSLLERVKRYVQWLFGLISYSQDAIESLAARSRRHFVPAKELKVSKEQLEAVQKQLAKAALAEERFHQAEQELRAQNLANTRYRALIPMKENARIVYENDYRAICGREEVKDAALIQQQQRIFALEAEVRQERNAHHHFRDELRNARLATQAKEEEVKRLQDRTRSQLFQLPRRPSEEQNQGRQGPIPPTGSHHDLGPRPAKPVPRRSSDQLHITPSGALAAASKPAAAAPNVLATQRPAGQVTTAATQSSPVASTSGDPQPPPPQ